MRALENVESQESTAESVETSSDHGADCHPLDWDGRVAALPRTMQFPRARRVGARLLLASVTSKTASRGLHAAAPQRNWMSGYDATGELRSVGERNSEKTSCRVARAASRTPGAMIRASTRHILRFICACRHLRVHQRLEEMKRISVQRALRREHARALTDARTGWRTARRRITKRRI